MTGEKSAAPQADRVNYKGLVEAANSIIISMNPKGEVTFINPFGLEFFGFSEAEMLGRPVLQTICPESFSEGSDADSMAAIVEDPCGFASHTNENIKKDGSRVWVSWSNRGIYDDKGQLVEILSVGNDITRLKQVEAELQHHRENLEDLVEERNRKLIGATQSLVWSQNRLMILDTISTCIIKDQGIDVTINQVLEKLAVVFKSVGVAYLDVLPGASLLTFNHAKADPPLPSLKGATLDTSNAAPLFKALIREFKPCAFKKSNKASEHLGMASFMDTTGLGAGLVVPVRNGDHLMGIIILYCVAVRAWSGAEKKLMVQVSESLAVGLGHLSNRNRLLAQEKFLEDVVDGVDTGIFVLRVANYGPVVFESVNKTFRRFTGLGDRKVDGRAMKTMASVMGPKELDHVRTHVLRCIEEKASVSFFETTRNEDGVRHWLTRLNPVLDGDGKVVRIIGAATDITEQKETEKALITKEARLREAQRIAKLGDFERDVHTRGLSCSDQLRQIFGWENIACPGHKDFLDILHPKDRESVEQTLYRTVEQNSPYDMEYRIVNALGEEKIVNEIGEVILDEAGKVTKISGIIQDVTEQKKVRDDIELASKVFDNAVEGVAVTDCDGTIQFINKGFTAITGYTEEEAIGRNPKMLKSGRHDSAFYRAMWDAIARDGHWAGEIWNRRKSGEAYPEWLSITAITNPKGEPVRYLSLFNDLSDLREREAQLSFQANYDALTGLPNRMLLQDRIQVSIQRVKRGNHGLSLIFLDMDDFKHVNDMLGHAKGDLLLQQFATRLLESIRSQDTVARYGGDEFIILLPDTSDTQVITQIIKRVRASLQEPFVVDNKEFFMEVSIGVTVCPDDGMEPDILIANADMAMYRSKASGRGGYAFFTPELNQQVARRVELEMDLRMGLSRQQFTLYFQPKLDIATRQISGAEALIRWEHPEKGIVSPMEFIPLAEETGLINDMGAWILNQAAVKAKEWSQMAGRPFPIAVNISPRQVRDVDLPEQVTQVLSQYQLPASCLELEITESAVMGNLEKAKAMFQTLDDMGIRISLDDFGTGFSSLSYLRQLPISTLKIDKSFVDDIPKDADSSTMVTTIITMARHLKLITVAEGVEDSAQLEFLRQNQCTQIQGYYFAPPMPAEPFADFIRKHL